MLGFHNWPIVYSSKKMVDFCILEMEWLHLSYFPGGLNVDTTHKFGLIGLLISHFFQNTDDKHMENQILMIGMRKSQERLVGGLEQFLFFHILGIVHPTDNYFSEGLKPPTSNSSTIWFFFYHSYILLKWAGS